MSNRSVRMRKWFICLALLFACASTSLARTEAPAAKDEAADVSGQPVISHKAPWASDMIIAIGAMFLAAAIIGVMVRATAPREVPPAHSHDEPPGASGHHGVGGTRDLN